MRSYNQDINFSCFSPDIILSAMSSSSSVGGGESRKSLVDFISTPYSLSSCFFKVESETPGPVAYGASCRNIVCTAPLSPFCRALRLITRNRSFSEHVKSNKSGKEEQLETRQKMQGKRILDRHEEVGT